MYCDIFCWIQTAFQTIKFFHKLQAHQHAESTAGANCSSDLAWNRAAPEVSPVEQQLRSRWTTSSHRPAAWGAAPRGSRLPPKHTPLEQPLVKEAATAFVLPPSFFSGSVSTDSGLLICGTSILNIMGCVIDLAIADALQA